MNAENIAKALKCCYPPEGFNTCEGCPYDGIEDPSCTERNIEYKAGEIIESLLAQLANEQDSIDCRNPVCNGNREGMYRKCAELEELLDAAIAGQETLQKALAESKRREQVLWKNLEDAVSKNAGCVLCVHEFGWHSPEEATTGQPD